MTKSPVFVRRKNFRLNLKYCNIFQRTIMDRQRRYRDGGRGRTDTVSDDVIRDVSDSTSRNALSSFYRAIAGRGISEAQYRYPSRIATQHSNWVHVNKKKSICLNIIRDENENERIQQQVGLFPTCAVLQFITDFSHSGRGVRWPRRRSGNSAKATKTTTNLAAARDCKT